MKNKGHKNRGNRAEQQRNRRKNNRGVEKQEEMYRMIDGNYTFYPYTYCCHYKGYMTKNMYERHSCGNRNCCHLKTFEEMKGKIS